LARELQKFHAKLFKKLSNLLEDPQLVGDYCFEQNHFTRKRKLPFQTVVILILQLLKSSVKTELKSFYKNVFNADEVVNWVRASSFCKARQKLMHQLFIDLNRFIVRFFYKYIGGVRWFHFRLLAVDGSCLNLPSSRELIERFGHHHTSSTGAKIPQARASFLSDVLNNIVIDSQIEAFKVGEQQMFYQHLCYIGKGDLLTADANYGHFGILKAILQTNADFCIRMSKLPNFINDFLVSGKKDIVLEWSPCTKTTESYKKRGIDPTPLKVRLVRIELSENETEVLALSLLDQEKYTYECIKKLYDKRWDVEEDIKRVMQRLMVEFFSSKKENGVLQDFYANIFMLNIVSFLAEPVKEQVKNRSKGNKYQRQINWTSALGDIRERFALLFLRDIDKIDAIIQSMWESFMINTEAIKPGRKFPRDKRRKGSRQKAFINYKPAW